MGLLKIKFKQIYKDFGNRFCKVNRW